MKRSGRIKTDPAKVRAWVDKSRQAGTLKADPDKVRAWQQASRAPLERTGDLRRSMPGATPSARKPPPPDPVTPAVRAIVAARSGGACEARATRACTGRAAHVHHRKLRRHGDHRPVNLLHVCVMCHDAIHGNVERAYGYGWLIPSYGVPEDIPVRPLAS